MNGVHECPVGNGTCVVENGYCEVVADVFQCWCERGWASSAVLSWAEGHLTCSRNIVIQTVLYSICISLSIVGLSLRVYLVITRIKRKMFMPVRVLAEEFSLSLLLLFVYIYFMLHPEEELYGPRNPGNVCLAFFMWVVFTAMSFNLAKMIRFFILTAKNQFKAEAGVQKKSTIRLLNVLLGVGTVLVFIPLVSLFFDEASFYWWMAVCGLMHEGTVTLLILFTLHHVMSVFERGMSILKPDSENYAKVFRARQRMLILRRWRISALCSNVAFATCILVDPTSRFWVSSYVWIVSVSFIELGLLQLARQRILMLSKRKVLPQS